MDLHGRTLRLGAAVIVGALLLRLTSTGFFTPVVQALEQPGVLSFLIYLETGRIVKLGNTPTAPPETEDTEPTLPIPSETEIPTDREAASFSGADMELVEMKYQCSYRPDVESLLTQRLDWDLTGQEPTVLIYHTHATESYTKSSGEVYTESAAYRTLDEDYNMIAVGRAVADALQAGGIQVIHDTALHDYPSYNGSYNSSRKTVEEYLEAYPSIRLVLDIHRDAADDGSGGQISPSVSVDGVSVAQIMLVVGTNSSGLDHPNWQENLALALKLTAQLEKNTPGLTRAIDLRSQRFNQDESSGALLIEMGAAGNTREEALRSAALLAQAILDLAYGANQT